MRYNSWLCVILQKEIHNRGFKLAMTEQSVDDMQIGSGMQQMCGKAVAKCMCCKGFVFEPCLCHRAVYNYLHTSSMNCPLCLFTGQYIFFRAVSFQVKYSQMLHQFFTENWYSSLSTFLLTTFTPIISSLYIRYTPVTSST